jgi:hypothetical protein
MRMKTQPSSTLSNAADSQALSGTGCSAGVFGLNCQVPSSSRSFISRCFKRVLIAFQRASAAQQRLQMLNRPSVDSVNRLSCMQPARSITGSIYSVFCCNEMLLTAGNGFWLVRCRLAGGILLAAWTAVLLASSDVHCGIGLLNCDQRAALHCVVR